LGICKSLEAFALQEAPLPDSPQDLEVPLQKEDPLFTGALCLEGVFSLSILVCGDQNPHFFQVGKRFR
jgi:hypothetical protein